MTSHSNDNNLESGPPVDDAEEKKLDNQVEAADSASVTDPEEAEPVDAATAEQSELADDAGVGASEATADQQADTEIASGESDNTAEQTTGTAAEETVESETPEEDSVSDEKQWYILKVQVNREDSIRDALLRRVKIAGLDEYFEEVVVPTEDVAEYNKSGKRRIVKRKLYPGYIMVHMTLNDDTWFLVRETPGIGDFTGSAGKPTPMEPREVQRIINLGRDAETGEVQVKTAIPFKMGERVRVKEGNFLNFEGEVSAIDEANGRVTVMINIFGRSTPVELEHWQIESV